MPRRPPEVLSYGDEERPPRAWPPRRLPAMRAVPAVPAHTTYAVASALVVTLVVAVAAALPRPQAPRGSAGSPSPTGSPERSYGPLETSEVLHRVRQAERTAAFVLSQYCDDAVGPHSVALVKHNGDYRTMTVRVLVDDVDSGFEIFVTLLPGGLSYSIESAWGRCRRV